MRLTRLTTNYPGYLADFYAERPGLATRGHDEQYRTLMDDCFGWADFWTGPLATHGWRAQEIVGNAEHLQKAWAREAGVAFAEDDWSRGIVFAQVRRFAPDVLFVNDAYRYDAGFLRDLRAAVPSIRLLVGWCGAPHEDYAKFRDYDLVLSNIDAFVDRFRGMGVRSEHLRHGFNTELLDRLGDNTAEPIEFGFCGSLFAMPGFHVERARLVARLVRDCGLQVNADIGSFGYGYTRERGLPSDLASYVLVEARKRLRALRGRSRPGSLPFGLVRAVRRPVYGLDMYRRLAATRVALNTHIDSSISDASNMRLFEATGMGTCLLTESAPNLGQIFEPDKEVVVYSSYDELRDKVRWLLDDDSSRRAIARAGQQRTLRDHAFAQRVAEFVDILGRCL